MRRRIVFILGVSLAAALAFVVPAAASDSRATRPRVHHASLTGAAEVPGPGDADGTGSAIVIVRPRSDTVCVLFRVREIALPAQMAHIHKGPIGVAGPVVIPLTPPDARGLSRTCAKADTDLVADIAENPAGYYVNVHTTDFPGGAIRGQLH